MIGSCCPFDLCFAIHNNPLAGLTVADVPIVIMQSARSNWFLASCMVSSGIGSPNITASNLTGLPHLSHGSGANRGTKSLRSVRFPHPMHLSRERLPCISIRLSRMPALMSSPSMFCVMTDLMVLDFTRFASA